MQQASPGKKSKDFMSLKKKVNFLFLSLQYFLPCSKYDNELTY